MPNLDDTVIRITIEDPPLSRGKTVSLQYRISATQAQDLIMGHQPPPMDVFACSEWDAKMKRATKFAEYVAAELAHSIIRALNAWS